jgi:hypothetical protein
VLIKDPSSRYAAEARERIEFLKPRAQRQVRKWAENDVRFQAFEKKAAAERAAKEAEKKK